MWLALTSILQAEGVQKILPIGNLNEYEKSLIQKAVPELQGNISKVSSLFVGIYIGPI